MALFFDTRLYSLHQESRVHKLHLTANKGEYIGDRSSITSKLWELRLRLRENLNPNRLANQPQVEVQTKGPKDSYVEIVVRHFF